MLDFLVAITCQEENTAQKNRVGPRVTEGTTASGNLREDILHEITQLSHVVLQIESHFTIIAKSIQHFDEAEALRDTAGHPLKFFPKWNSCREIYSFLLSSSRSTAGQLKRKINSSLKALIPLINNSSASLGNKQVYVIEFIESLGEFQVRGAGTVQEFYDLRERIRNLERDLNREMETQDTDAEQRIKEILNSIKQLEAEIEAASGFFAACRSVIDVRKVLSSASVIAFAPVSSALSLVSGVKAVGNAISQGLDRRAQEIQGKKNNILSLQLEKESLLSQRKKLREIRP
ncbi:hypothetical protein BDZ94DRAFT_1256901 [Collybia nuda]|uniref:Uncharacterized protein n=1 Tax=Collybia nuda TaxID=64659 RepID=A0A9P6CFS8_9AGAR|nr:hypothetical protein BDZ94DRAFT_1256901 [Collybia nuda]